MSGSKVPLVVFGCAHIGAKTADLKMLDSYIDAVNKYDGFALLLSDNFENAIATKPGMMFDQVMTPEEQLDYGVKVFGRIKDKIIGACSGNHTSRTRKQTSLDMDKIMAQKLGYEDNYFPYQGFVSLKVGKVRYRIAFKHGHGQGSNSFGNAINLHRAYPDADICCSSHTHTNGATTKGRWTINSRGGRALHNITLVNTGCLLDYPRYGDEAYYQPQPKGFTTLWLDREKYEVIPDITSKFNGGFCG